jgi:hypothetical protein
MHIRDVWRPLTVAVVVGGTVLLPQGVAVAAPTNPVSCATIDRGLLGANDDLLGRRPECRTDQRNAAPVSQPSTATVAPASTASSRFAGLTSWAVASWADDDTDRRSRKSAESPAEDSAGSDDASGTPAADASAGEPTTGSSSGSTTTGTTVDLSNGSPTAATPGTTTGDPSTGSTGSSSGGTSGGSTSGGSTSGGSSDDDPDDDSSGRSSGSTGNSSDDEDDESSDSSSSGSSSSGSSSSGSVTAGTVGNAAACTTGTTEYSAGNAGSGLVGTASDVASGSVSTATAAATGALGGLLSSVTGSDDDEDSSSSGSRGSSVGSAVSKATGTLATLPSQLLDLSYWKLTLPTGSEGKPTEIDSSRLTSFSNQYFHTNETGDGVVFWANVGGSTTSGSSYPRSELREMTESGEKAAWDSRTGTYTMDVCQAITKTPSAKPEVVSAQIHDGSDDVMQIRLEGKKLVVQYNDGDSEALLDPDYQLGTPFRVRITANQEGVGVSYNGQQKAQLPLSGSGWYWKVGAYVQSNTSKGDSADAAGEVVVYSLSCTKSA